MTESIDPPDAAAVRAAMEAELSGVDAIARFKFNDDWKIHHFGAHIDAIPSLSPEYGIALRKIANLYNEPDTESQAFDEAPPFEFPASQERFDQLRTATEFDSYLQFSQSQSQTNSELLSARTSQPASASTSLLPSNSAGTSLGTPAPNQQANRQQLIVPVRGLRSPSPLRKSPRTAVPKVWRGYVMEEDSGSKAAGKRKAVPDNNDASGSIAGRHKTINISTSGSESEEELTSPNKSGTSRKRRVIADTDEELDPAQPASKARRGAYRPTATEITAMDVASRIPENEPTLGGTSARRPLASAATRAAKSRAARASHTPAPARTPASNRSANSMSGEEPEVQDPDDSLAPRSPGDRSASLAPPSPALAPPSPGDRSTSLAPPKARMIPGAVYEGDIAISGPAKASKLGLALSSGYDNFEYLYSWRDAKGVVKEKWQCLKCDLPYTASKAGHNTNLISHRGLCKGKRGIRRGNQSTTESQANTAVSGGPSNLASTTIAASSYRGQSVSGWIGGQQITHPLLTRRLGLIAVIQNALPFQHLQSPDIVAMIKSIDARATMSLKSAKTVRRDLTRFHAALKGDVHRELQGIDTLVSLQHDAWTTKAYQHSFVALIASYVSRDWDYREVLLSFDVITDKHTGATFSGHLIRTLTDYALDDKWYGPVTSDSTGVNHRMLDVLQFDLLRKKMQQRNVVHADEAKKDDKVAPSSFSHASTRKKGSWKAKENKVLCLNHHVNIAVRAGFARFGIKFKAKAKRKVLDIRPAPSITITDENGHVVEAPEPEDGDSEDEVEEPTDAGVAVRARPRAAQGSHDDEGSGSDNDAEDEADTAAAAKGYDDALVDDEDEDDAHNSDMEPSPSEVGSDDEGGPAAEPTDEPVSARGANTTADPDVPTSAITKLEAFTVDIHRSPQRRAKFRSCMEKEYYRSPKKAQAPFPPKPNGTRWNSHWAMIKASLKIRDAIDAHCRAHIGSKKGDDKFGSYLLTDAQWRQLELLQPVLRLASAVTMSMEQAEGTLYMVLDHHASLRDEMDMLMSKVDDEIMELDTIIATELREFCEAMSDKLKKYRDIALDSRLTLTAALLHPLNRMELFDTAYPDYTKRAEKAIRSLLAELFGNPTTSSSSTAEKSIGFPGRAAGPISPLSAARARRRQLNSPEGSRDKSSTTDKMPDEVDRYLDAKLCPWRDSDKSPYKWWKDNEEVFPNIAKLARLVLGIPGSSSSVERVFSQAALFSTNRRSRLNAESISRLVTTKHWLKNGGDKLAGLDDDVRRCAKMIAELPVLTSK